MKKLFFVVSIAIVFTSLQFLSGCTEDYSIQNDYSDTNAKNASASLCISNELGEKYDVAYQESNGFPDRLMDIEIYKVDETTKREICNYSTEFNEKYIPKEIMYLFGDKYDYYYIADEEYIYIISIYAKTGERHKQMRININYSKVKYIDEYLDLSKILNNNISRDELINRFNTCQYDSTSILKLYDLKP